MRGSAFVALKQLECKNCVLSEKYRWLLHLTFSSIKNAFKRGELLVFVLSTLILHSSTCLFAWQRFNWVETVGVQNSF